jgi:hypothetical protein
MALQGNDLFVVQSQTDSKLYKLKVSDLIVEVEGGAGINFKGSVDLNNAPGSQTPDAIILPGQNGDLYVVESDAGAIDAGWVMVNGETSADEGDRIIYDADDAGWVLVTVGSNTTGTVTGVTATLPLKSDNDAVEPVITIRQARTTTGATGDGDGEGTAGAVARLAENDDVKHTDGTGSSTAVVTANLLKATNDIVNGLALSPGGVTTVTTTDANGNSALSISPTAGNVVIELKTASDSEYGVVQIADASAITNGTAGPSAVIDASQLQDAIDNLPQTALNSITEGGTDIVTGALQIATDASNDVTIGVNAETFAPYDFSTLDDINA